MGEWAIRTKPTKTTQTELIEWGFCRRMSRNYSKKNVIKNNQNLLDKPSVYGSISQDSLKL